MIVPEVQHIVKRNNYQEVDQERVLHIPYRDFLRVATRRVLANRCELSHEFHDHVQKKDAEEDIVDVLLHIGLFAVESEKRNERVEVARHNAAKCRDYLPFEHEAGILLENEEVDNVDILLVAVIVVGV